jgi:hypothetical protein
MRDKHISRHAKCMVRFPAMRDTSEPYEAQIISVANLVFRRDVAALGNCNWGYIEFLCWGYQVQEFRECLIQKGRTEFAKYAVEVALLDRWPSYPINATGDITLTGINSEMSYPNLIADARKELADLEKKIESRKKALLVLTGEEA